MIQLTRLKSKLAEICDLKGAASVLGWDQQTYMPPGGANARAEQLATLEKLSHEMFVSAEMGELLEGAAAEVSALAYDSDEASLVRVTRRDYDKARKIPPALVAEIARTTSLGMEVWVKAKAESNFAVFQPILQKIYQLHQALANCLGFEERMYDALLDQYEPDMKTSALEEIFANLKAELVPMVHALSDKLNSVDGSVLHRHYDGQKQWDFGTEVLKRFGYDFEKGRQDKSVHPFTTSFSINDVRITTHVDENFLSSALFGTLHEGGHALYDQGISPSLERSPLSAGASLGIHESQSRLWENPVGRSLGFWKFFYPRLQSIFPDSLAPVSLEAFYQAINRVQPSLIRVEADEITYNLHIMIRFELEVDLLEERLKVADLPAAWNARMKDYLGIVPSKDAEGVLQDVHWSHGLIGYFPTYSLGNLISVQLFEQAKAENRDIPSQIERGHFSGLLEWLRTHVHRHGRKFLPLELVERATGSHFRAEPYIDYLKNKYSEIYLT
ncbi:MAG: carboxypeptidase [Acidobacteria bacterium]|nr:MAG: carboxypeptidase [Acidobacteriota bacterium]